MAQGWREVEVEMEPNQIDSIDRSQRRENLALHTIRLQDTPTTRKGKITRERRKNLTKTRHEKIELMN